VSTRPTLLLGDVRERLAGLEPDSVQCVVTSPPYWGLRDYQVEGQIGLEATPEEYVTNMVEVFRAVRRVLRGDGVLWLNMGDSYAQGGKRITTEEIEANKKRGAVKQYFNQPTGWTGRGDRAANTVGSGLKPKDLVGMPWRLALALQADGWWLRSDIIWSKPNPMPSSVTDRPTTAHEYIFLLTKSARYFYDADAVREGYAASSVPRMKYTLNKLKHEKNGARPPHPDTSVKPNPAGRNLRSVWTFPTKGYPGAHFATFPEALPERCIEAGTSHRACGTCGAPWARVVERSPMEIKRSFNHPPELRTRTSGTMIKPLEIKTTGFRPTCDCDDPGEALCVVLDPFAGSGTTCAVAARLGRASVGIELSPEYMRLAEDRCWNGSRSLAEFSAPREAEA